MASKPEHEPTWYSRSKNGWRFGCTRLHIAASIAYLTFSLFPLVHFVLGGFQIPGWVEKLPLLVLFWAAVTALGCPVWAWQEARVFENWVRKFEDEDIRKAEGAYFTLQANLAKNFWTAVLAIYTIAGLVGVAMKEPQRRESAQQTVASDRREDAAPAER